jgi:hypothetical protein
MGARITWRPVLIAAEWRSNIASTAAAAATCPPCIDEPVQTGYCHVRRPGGESGAERGYSVPEFMDVHTTMQGVTPEALAEAHNADLAIQDEEGVNFKHAWADPESGMVFCLSEAPSAEAVRKIHERAGHPADDIYQVPVQA